MTEYSARVGRFGHPSSSITLHQAFEDVGLVAQPAAVPLVKITLRRIVRATFALLVILDERVIDFLLIAAGLILTRSVDFADARNHRHSGNYRKRSVPTAGKIPEKYNNDNATNYVHPPLDHCNGVHYGSNHFFTLK